MQEISFVLTKIAVCVPPWFPDSSMISCARQPDIILVNSLLNFPEIHPPRPSPPSPAKPQKLGSQAKCHSKRGTLYNIVGSGLWKAKASRRSSALSTFDLTLTVITQAPGGRARSFTRLMHTLMTARYTYVPRIHTCIHVYMYTHHVECTCPISEACIRNR